jgi:hypothetical protein
MRHKRLFLLSILISVLISFSLLYLVGVFSENGIQTNGDTSMDAAWAVIETSDGGYALAGLTQTVGTEDGDFWLIKTDEYGNVEWNQTYGGKKFETAYSLVETSDGGYAIAGDTQSFGAGDSDFWLVKTDENGTVEWTKTYDKGADERAYSLVEASDGGYVLAGDISYSSDDLGYGWSDAWLVKTDESGNLEWSRRYGGAGFDCAYGLVEASDGGYVLVGFTQVWGDGWNDFWLVKTDPNGNLDWSHTYGGDRPQNAYALVEASDGGYVLAGFTELSDAELSAFWLVKTDKYGYMAWNQTIGVDYDYAWALVEVSDGGYALAGRTDYLAPDGYDVVLIKTDKNGKVKWNQTYGSEMSEEAYSLVATSDGGFIIAGYTSSSGYEYPDCWLTKTDANGDMQWNRTYG